jgi:hypothetical protein
VDGANAGNTADGATQSVTGVASNVGGKAAKETLPTVSKTGGKTVKKTTPVAQKTAGDTAGTAGAALGDTAKGATKGGLPTDSVAKGGLPTGKLPVKSPLG